MGVGGTGLASTGGRRDPDRAGATSFSDAAAAIDDDASEGAEARGEVHAIARGIAARLVLVPPRRRRRTRGAGELVSLPYRGGSDEIDLDRTIDVLTERRPLLADDIVVRERRQRRWSVVLAVDVSGSMRGARIRTAAATVGALTAGLGRGDLSVLAFWSDAAVLLRIGEQASLEQLVDAMLAIEPVGLTNVAFPLGLAEAELRRVPGRHGRVVLLSDCVHNAGPDPQAFAQRLPRLDVLFDVSGENDAGLAAGLARHGRGHVGRVQDHRDVPPALNRLFSD